MSDRDGQFTLPDGSFVTIRDIVAGEMYGSFIVNSPREQWEPFSAARSQLLPGDAKRSVTRADSNLLRPGYLGLPHEYEAWIYRWRASTALPMCERLERFAAHVACSLTYADRHYAHATLLDLLRTPPGWPSDLATLSCAPDAAKAPALPPRAPPDVLADWPTQDAAEFSKRSRELVKRDDAYKLPVHFRENLGFSVKVSLETPEAFDDFRRWLHEDQHPTSTRLREIADRSEDRHTADQLRAWAAELSPAREPIFKIHLEGLFRRPIV